MDVSTEQYLLDTEEKLKYFVNIWRIIRGSNTMLNTDIKTSFQLCSTWRKCKDMELLCYLRPWADEFQIVSGNSTVQLQDISLWSRAWKCKSCNMTMTYNMGIIGTYRYSDRYPVLYNGQEKVLTYFLLNFVGRIFGKTYTNLVSIQEQSQIPLNHCSGATI